MSRLDKIVILTESQNSWKPSMQQHVSDDLVAQLKFYLPTTVQSVRLFETLSIAAADNQIDVEFLIIEDPDLTTQRMRSSVTAYTCFWIVSDGRVFHQSARVNSWLELMGYRYFGIDTTIQALTDNKYLMSTIMAKHDVAVPSSWLYRADQELASLKGAEKNFDAFFVKPNTLGSQVCISKDSKTSSMKEAIDLSCEVYDALGTECIIQAYIEGRDVRSSVVDTDKLGRLQECSFVDVLTKDGSVDPFSTNKALSGRNWELTHILEQDPIAVSITEVIERVSSFGLVKDYCAIDFRISDDGKCFFLENNVKPFATLDAFQPMAELNGYGTVGALFVDSIKHSLKRNG